MKFPIKLLLLFLLIVLCASFSTINPKPIINKVSNQKGCIDSSLVKNYMKSYEIQVPKGWCSYIYHDYLLINTPNEKNFKTNTNDGSRVYVSWSKKSKNIEKALKKHLVIKSIFFYSKPVYVSEYHEIYGKYYLIKHLRHEYGEKYITLRALFNYKKRDYIIYYDAKESEFETYLPEAINMISTFKIKD